jgi:hypothetical protein
VFSCVELVGIQDVQDDQDGGRLQFDGPWLRQIQAKNLSNHPVKRELMMQPSWPSVPMTLNIGKLCFQQDGLWVVGQELGWQED